MKKVFRTLLISMLISASMSTIAFAEQSSRWYEQSGVWYLKNEQGTGNVINSWFQDLDGSWYVLSPTGSMYAGLIHDNITGKDYYLQINHDGYYGRMAVTDGVYNINGQQVYLTFNSVVHDGTYGCITTGLSELQRVGVPITNVDGLPTDTAQPTQPDRPTPPKETPPPTSETKQPSSGNFLDTLPPINIDDCGSGTPIYGNLN